MVKRVYTTEEARKSLKKKIREEAKILEKGVNTK